MFGYNIHEYELNRVLAQTETSTIHLARWKKTSVVVSQCRIDQQDETSLERIHNEITCMRQLLHPHILEVYVAFVQAADIYVVSPLLRYGSCRDVMNGFCVVGFPEIITSLIARDVLLALDYLHKKSYIHRSIRASHVLLGDKAVLAGFKECASLVFDGRRIRKMHDLPSSPKELVWLAPEVLEQNLTGYTEKSDIYSFGITLCELGNNLTPFAEMTNTLMLVEKLRGNQPSLLDASTYAVDTDDAAMGGHDSEEVENYATATQHIYSQRKLSDPFHNFVEICLRSNQFNRPGADQLLQHAFIKQSRHTTLKSEMEELQIDTLDVDVPKNATENAISLNFGELTMNDEEEEFSWDF